ncbi:MAG: adenylosuccinate synthase [Saprospiraceae bacterium]
MKVDVILGLQWGDEGKGKIVDFLAEKYDIVCRFQGGPNAGHTIKVDGKKYVLHTVPSGILREGIINVIGNGVVLDPITLVKELSMLDSSGIKFRDRLYVSNKAHLIIPTHRYLDLASENAKGASKIGSTLKGIGPTYMDKTGRNGLRVGDIKTKQFRQSYNTLKAKHINLLKLYPDVDFNLDEQEDAFFQAIETLSTLKFINAEYYINDALQQKKRILAEGAQGSMLDIDFGTYPFVTSSNTISAGVCSGLGIAPNRIGEVIGVAKAYCTRVGSGPFPTELDNEVGEKLRANGSEFGATTGRPRRCGWIDIPQLLYTIMVNGVSQIVITKLDVLDDFDTIEVGRKYKYDNLETSELPFDLVGTPIDIKYFASEGWKSDISAVPSYEALPALSREYLDTLEKELNTKITLVSTGPEREKLFIRKSKLN